MTERYIADADPQNILEPRTGFHRYLIKKSDHNNKLLSIEATFGFLFALLTFWYI